jgi:hypothetical protein
MKTLSEFVSGVGSNDTIKESSESTTSNPQKPSLADTDPVSAISSTLKDPNFWYGIVYYTDEATMKDNGGKVVALIHSRWKKKTHNPEENMYDIIISGSGLETLFLTTKASRTFVWKTLV